MDCLTFGPVYPCVHSSHMQCFSRMLPSCCIGSAHAVNRLLPFLVWHRGLRFCLHAHYRARWICGSTGTAQLSMAPANPALCQGLPKPDHVSGQAPVCRIFEGWARVCPLSPCLFFQDATMSYGEVCASHWSRVEVGAPDMHCMHEGTHVWVHERPW